MNIKKYKNRINKIGTFGLLAIGFIFGLGIMYLIKIPQMTKLSTKPSLNFYSVKSNCPSLIDSLKKTQLYSISDFGYKYALYMKNCMGAPNLIIDLGYMSGAEHYSYCQYLPDFNIDKSGKTTYKDGSVDCQAQTRYSVWTQNNQSGTLYCDGNNTTCRFSPNDTSPTPAPNEPQNFTTTTDGKHGMNCTPYDANKKENNATNNLNEITKKNPNITPFPTLAPYYDWNCQPY